MVGLTYGAHGTSSFKISYILLIAAAVIFVIFLLYERTLADKYGQSQFTMTGLILSSIALFLFSTTGATTTYSLLSLYMVLLGVGTGLFVAPNLRAVMSSVPTERHGIGSALFILFLNIGLTVSLNFAVLIMSFTAPYDLITKILVVVNPQTIDVSEKALFLASLKNTYLAFAIINTLALIPTEIGGRIKRAVGTSSVGE